MEEKKFTCTTFWNWPGTYGLILIMYSQYLYLRNAVFILNSFPENFIIAEWKSVGFHVVIGILSSLCCHGRDFCPASEINLKPLEFIVSSCGPTSVFTTTSRKEMEPANVRSRADVIGWARSCDSRVWYLMVLHPNGFHALRKFERGKTYAYII